MTITGYFCGAGEGEELCMPDAQITVKADDVFEVDAVRGASVPPHAEPWTKTYYMLFGRMGVLVGEEIYDLAPGSSVTIPAGALNTFTVHSPTAKFLAIGAMGGFFRDASSGMALSDVLARHGITL
ncbi:cupin domain-containing protein [Actinocrispum sp. NPDC049592]|uniref:cupin domain-containing protein n=1 Tax=Actinocrispum sp. NPDC049592 TaxID=3154835 RepID=UPI0034406E27